MAPPKPNMQSSRSILLVRPAHFMFNAETAHSNAFQRELSETELASKQNALLEFDALAKGLISKGVDVSVIDDSEYPIKPDALFPNNWVSFHSNGTVLLYPMLAANRRLERRKEVLDIIREKFEIREIIDLSANEDLGEYLEGTGSIIFDHVSKTAYACLSPRTNKALFLKVCKRLGYRPVHFHAFDLHGKAVYHTNVVMTIGNDFSVICLESIVDEQERELVTSSLTQSGHHIIAISQEQMTSFCGNMLELQLVGCPNILAMSQSAHDSLSGTQKLELANHCELFPLSIPTIENIGGGSVRCMIAEIFLPLKDKQAIAPTA